MATLDVAQAADSKSQSAKPHTPDFMGDLMRGNVPTKAPTAPGAAAEASDPSCKDLYRKPQSAADLSSKLFEECYYGQTDKNGRSRELVVPTSRALWGINKSADITKEKITTQGGTADSRMLKVYMDSKDSTLQVTSENPGEPASKGTGFFVSKDGLFATDYHCIENLKPDGKGEISVTMPDGTMRPVKVVGLDKGADLALLKVEPNPGEEFKPLKLGKSTDFRAGEPMAALGKAWGNDLLVLNPTNYRGMVNQYRIPMAEQPSYVNQNRTLMVTDSLVAPGNSGGPAMRLDGTVAGSIVYSNISSKMYFTPVERLNELIAKYEKNKK